MVDYVRDTGSTGKMMIRDTGTEVEFWITSGNTTTYTSSLPWGWTINGSTGSLTYNYPANGNWRRLGNYLVTSSQTVYFRIGATGTAGFGGPTEHSAYINRAIPPPAPTQPQTHEVTTSSIRVTFIGNGDGGSAIIMWQLGYGTDPHNIVWTVDHSSGNTTVSGLTAGTTYYFWARGLNSLGWGPWSPVSVGRATLGYAGTLEAPAMSAIKQKSAIATFSSDYPGILEYQVGYHTSPTLNPTTRISATSPVTVTNLPPATTLYFRVRARTNAGWNSWSAATMIRTIAGGRVKVGAEWKEAIPYVKHSGVWKVAAPQVKELGIWKQVT